MFLYLIKTLNISLVDLKLNPCYFYWNEINKNQPSASRIRARRVPYRYFTILDDDAEAPLLSTPITTTTIIQEG